MINKVVGFRWFTGLVFLSGTLFAQQPDPSSAPDPKPVEEAAKPPVADAPKTPTDPCGGGPLDKRIFVVLPNYRTATDTSTTCYTPISSRHKLWIGFKDSFDYPIFLTSAAYAGIYMLENTHPQFGQGVLGYAKRYGTTSTDLVVGNFMTESVMPILLHQDPRYFSKGPAYGGVWKRFGYAATRVLVCKSDQGKPQFNFSEILGNSVAVAISNTYYTDARSVGSNVEALGIQVGTDAISNVLKEFWPDVKQRFFKKKTSTPAND